eukprot:GILJ01017921.1.p1 GENE.GILJ01017921.1~~GILJ01017921.1.p1  ORF type:complete len:175 (-),score=22.03 GILJ01017921.1:137-661(-)
MGFRRFLLAEAVLFSVLGIAAGITALAGKEWTQSPRRGLTDDTDGYVWASRLMIILGSVALFFSTLGLLSSLAAFGRNRHAGHAKGGKLGALFYPLAFISWGVGWLCFLANTWALSPLGWSSILAIAPLVLWSAAYTAHVNGAKKTKRMEKHDTVITNRTVQPAGPFVPVSVMA